MEEKLELNLDNPIFVYYYNCQNMTTQRVENQLEVLSKRMSQYTNITFWIVPADYNKIDCVFDGYKSNKYSLDKLSDALESMINDPSLSEFKQKMREILIGDILDEESKAKI